MKRNTLVLHRRSLYPGQLCLGRLGQLRVSPAGRRAVLAAARRANWCPTPPAARRSSSLRSKASPRPNFTLEDLSGKKVSLAGYKGKAVLINFWATWCGPCKIETPWLIELRNQYASQGFEILGISADDLDRDDPQVAGQREAGDRAVCHSSAHALSGADRRRLPSASLTAAWTSCPPPSLWIATAPWWPRNWASPQRPRSKPTSGKASGG